MERCRKLLAKRNTGARLDACLDAVGSSVDGAVEQFERRLDVSVKEQCFSGCSLSVGAMASSVGGAVDSLSAGWTRVGTWAQSVHDCCSDAVNGKVLISCRSLLTSSFQPRLVNPGPCTLAAFSVLQQEKRLVAAGQPGAGGVAPGQFSADDKSLYCLCQQTFHAATAMHSEWIMSEC